MSGENYNKGLAAAILAAALLPLGCGRRPASLDVSPRKVTIFGVGRGANLTVRVLDSSGTAITEDQPITYSAAPEGVVQAEASGHLTAKKAGRATVTISAGKLSTTVPVEVRDAANIDIVPASLKLIGPRAVQSQLEISAKTADGKPATAGPVSWSIKDPRIATVTRDGVVSSVSPGKTTVTAKLGDLLSEADVEVQIKNISRLEIHPDTAILRVGESERFSVLAYDEEGLLIPDAAAHFSTLSTTLVKISGDGRATGLAKGTAIIQATIGDKSARATVLVN